jgi:uncharacterized protein
MQLTQHRNENQLFVRKADARAITVVDREFSTSLILSANTVDAELSVRDVAGLDAAAIERILALHPDVILLGTGASAVFPPQRVLAEFLRRGIGVETMDNAAAARTFNVLVGEGRNAVAVFLLAGNPA